MLNFLSFEMLADGYGSASIAIAKSLKHIAPETNTVDIRAADRRWGTVGDRVWDVEGDTILMATPEWLPYVHVTNGRLFCLTMFEATKLPAGWVDILNTYAGAVFVPCEWNLAVFRANGVMPQIHVVKFGVDGYSPLKRKRTNEPYTFLWHGTPDLRKGWDVCYKAFWQAFKGNSETRLIMHFRELPKKITGCDDANVEIVSGLLEPAEYRNLLQRADCFVFPSRGEGWGLPPREAAATGLPVIATNWGGLAEDIDYWAMPVPVRGMSPADYGFFESGTVGEWAEPNTDEVVARMRWCFENQRSAKNFGRNAAEWLKTYANYDMTARAILEIVNAD